MSTLVQAPPSTRYRWVLAGVVLVALGLRVAYILGPAAHVRLAGDSTGFYRPVAQRLANLDGFTRMRGGQVEHAVSLPPMFSFLLAGLDVVRLRSVQAQQLVLAFGGSLALVAVAEVGRRLHGARVGLVAAGIAAVDPLWITHSAALMTESLVLILVPLILLAAIRCTERPTPARYAVLGLLCGLEVLTRTDALALVALLAVAMVFAVPGGARPRLGGVVVMGLVALAVIAPWSIRNKVQVDTWALSTNRGNTTSGANCDAVYGSAPLLGSWELRCSYQAASRAGYRPDHPWSWPELDARTAAVGMQYMRDHKDRLPSVVRARVERTWGIYPIEHQLLLAQQEGRSRTWERRGLELWRFWLVPFVAGVGLALYRRDRRDLILAAPIVQVTLVSAAVYGSTRMRAGAQPAIVVFIAVGIVSAASWIGQRWRARPGARDAVEATEPSGHLNR